MALVRSNAAQATFALQWRQKSQSHRVYLNDTCTKESYHQEGKHKDLDSNKIRPTILAVCMHCMMVGSIKQQSVQSYQANATPRILCVNLE